MLPRHGKLKFVSFWATLIIISIGVAAWMTLGVNNERAAQFAGEAEAFRQAKDYRQAQTAIRSAISIRDDVPEFYILLGRINFQAGQLSPAFGAYDVALSLSPTNQEALLAVAQIGIQIGELDKSRDATRRLLLIDPRFPEALLVRGLHHQIRKNYGEALEDANAILSIEPNHESAMILKVRATLLDGDEDLAREILEDFAAQNESTTGLALTKLEVYRQLGDAAGLAETFEALQRHLPDNNRIRVDEANFLFKRGEIDKATSLVARTLGGTELRPQELTALIGLLENYSSTEELLPHLPFVERNAGTDAKNEVAKYLISNGQLSAAQPFIDDLEGIEAEALKSLEALERGDFVEAIKLTDVILAKDSSHCFSLYIRARAEVGQEMSEAAIRSAQRAAAECPTLGGSWETLAEAYRQLDNPLQIRRAFRQGVEANPQDPRLVDKYVDYLISEGNSREALAARRQLVRRIPAFSPAWQTYFDLCKSLGASCVLEAGNGLSKSRALFRIDPPPGERAPSGLFGRFLIR